MKSRTTYGSERPSDAGIYPGQAGRLRPSVDLAGFAGRTSIQQERLLNHRGREILVGSVCRRENGGEIHLASVEGRPIRDVIAIELAGDTVVLRPAMVSQSA